MERRLEAFRTLYRQRRAVRWLVEGTVLFAIVLGVSAWQTRAHVRGAPLPPAVLQTLDGHTISLASLAGRPTLLAFWAPWCGVCKADSDNVSRVARWVGGRAQVVSVALAYDDRASVERYVTERGVDYPVLLGDNALAHALHVDSFPTIYFVSADGRVSSSAVGWLSRRRWACSFASGSAEAARRQMSPKRTAIAAASAFEVMSSFS